LDNHPKTTKTFIQEGIVSIFLVLVFFAIFLVFLNRLFPAGILYKSLIKDVSLSEQIAKPQYDRMINFSYQNRGRALPDIGFAAVLESKTNMVKGKRANAVAWAMASPGMLLYDHDALQTQNKSGATIKFDQDNIVEMKENSLIVIKKLEEDFIFREKRSFIVVADGEFRGKFFSTPDKPLYVELATPTATARIKPSYSLDKPVDFKVKINPDSSSTFIVYEGKAEIEAKGQKIELNNRQKTFAGVDKAPMVAVNLPDPVKLQSPTTEKTFLFSKLPPEITFRWEEEASEEGYVLEISKSPSFEERILQTTTNSNEFTVGNLRNGSYYWRVATIKGFDDEIFSDPRRITITQDTTPPNLTVDFPVDIVDNSTVVFDGKTDPDATLYINNRRVDLSGQGAFIHEQELNPGINVVVVEAVDPAGNSSYKSKYFNAK